MGLAADDLAQWFRTERRSRMHSCLVQVTRSLGRLSNTVFGNLRRCPLTIAESTRCS